MNAQDTLLTRRAMLGGLALTTAVGATIASGPALAETNKAAVAATAEDVSALPRRQVKLVAPPNVHAHDQVARGGPEVVEFTMTTIEEKQLVIDEDGTTIHGMTFNGSVPGPLLVVHEGDYVELTLVNPPTTRCSTISTSTPRPARSAAGR